MTNTKEEILLLNDRLKELSDDELSNVAGGTSEEIMNYMISLMEGVVIVDATTLAQISNLSSDQKGTLILCLQPSIIGLEASKEQRYTNFTNYLLQYGISTSGCQRAFQENLV